MKDCIGEISTVTAAEYNIKVYGGDSQDLELVFEENDGTPIDLTGTDFSLMVKEHSTDPDSSALGFYSISNGGLVIGTGSDTNKLSLVADIEIKGGDFVYDLEAIDAGKTITWLYGCFKVLQKRTHNNNEL